MSSDMQPPRLDTGIVQDESSDDHFSSASEGDESKSPIPITRVERVDDTAAHGEVPGTPAYNLRTKDAVPDEIEVVPEGRRSRSDTTTRSRAASQLSTGSRPGTPGGSPVPKTVVERVDDKPSYGEVDGTPAKEMRMADAVPDEIRKAPEETRQTLEGRSDEVDDEGRQEWFRSMWEGNGEDAEKPSGRQQEVDDQADDDDNDNDDFGDDFDEFAEEGDDFGDFDAADETPSASAPAPAPAPQPPPPDILGDLPPLDLSTCTTTSEIEEAIQPYLTAILSESSSLPPKSEYPTLNAQQTSPFLSDRSLSLWQQLVSPPPMQPPNWTRSRIRRLFLVSLGVPVDLDEILPPSKQKRLVLPSIGLDGTPRPSTAIDRLRDQDGANASTTSLDSKTGAPKPSSKKRSALSKGPPPPPDFDLNAAALLCSTTSEALAGFEDAELREHLAVLERLNGEASAVLEYWLMRKDEAVKEKEALEGVIENLVGFVKGRRGK